MLGQVESGHVSLDEPSARSQRRSSRPQVRGLRGPLGTRLAPTAARISAVRGARDSTACSVRCARALPGLNGCGERNVRHAIPKVPRTRFRTGRDS